MPERSINRRCHVSRQKFVHVSGKDETKCSGCGICADNLCWATYLENKKAKVWEEECGACALCVAVCPQEAIRLGPTGRRRIEAELWACHNAGTGNLP